MTTFTDKIQLLNNERLLRLLPLLSSLNISYIPTVALIGNQSSGKSTVLKHLLNLDIFPIGEGLQTKCPVKILLLKSEKTAYEFNGKRKTLEELKRSIKNHMDSIEGISSDEIILNLYDKSYNNLILIDLPGLAQIPLDNQSTSIENDIIKLNLRYIENECTLILCVMAANVDLVNNCSLKIAKTVDNNYSRTIGIMTKLDISTINLIEIFNNRSIFLNCGYLGLNRLSDCKDDLSIFKDRIGIENINRILSKFLLKLLRKYFNKIEKKLRTRKLNLEKTLRLGGEGEIRKIIFTAISEYTQILSNSFFNLEITGVYFNFKRYKNLNRYFDRNYTEFKYDEEFVLFNEKRMDYFYRKIISDFIGGILNESEEFESDLKENISFLLCDEYPKLGKHFCDFSLEKISLKSIELRNFIKILGEVESVYTNTLPIRYSIFRRDLNTAYKNLFEKNINSTLNSIHNQFRKALRVFYGGYIEKELGYELARLTKDEFIRDGINFKEINTEYKNIEAILDSMEEIKN